MSPLREQVSSLLSSINQGTHRTPQTSALLLFLHLHVFGITRFSRWYYSLNSRSSSFFISSTWLKFYCCLSFKIPSCSYLGKQFVLALSTQICSVAHFQRVGHTVQKITSNHPLGVHNLPIYRSMIPLPLFSVHFVISLNHFQNKIFFTW